MDVTAAVRRLEQLGRSGLTVSIACGPSGVQVFAWSVTVMAEDGREFEMPYQALSFTHAIEIVDAEVTRRGWLP